VNTPVTFYLTGTYVLRLTATDGHVSAFDDVTVTVVPPVNDGPIADAGGDLTVVRPNAALLLGAVYDDGLPFGYPLTYQWSKVSGPGTVTFVTVSNTTENATHWENVDGVDAIAFATFSTNGEYVLSLTAADTEFTNITTATITVLAGTNSPPVVNAGPDFIVALPDQAVLVSDVTDDGLEQGWIEMYWTAVSGPGPVWFSTLNGTYRATFITPGEYVLRLTAHDGSLTNHDDVTVTVYDTPPPTAEIQSPLDGAIITSPTNVIGTTSSDLLQSYVLEYRLRPAESDSSSSSSSSSSSNWTILTSNTVSIVSNVLGQLDPTLSLNGIYELRLTATDSIGRSVTTEPITVIFDRNLKVGQFTISFNDLSIPVPGLPLQVTRTYDSRAAAAGIQGDFGIGWTMDLRNVRLQKNRSLARNWVQTTTGSPFDLSLAYHLNPINQRIVTITFPDGRVEKFRFDPRPVDQPFLPIGYPQWRFTPLDNTRGTLVPAGFDDPDGSFLFFFGAIPGTADLVDLNFFFDALTSGATDEELQQALEHYPTLFRYTSPEGYKYLIDENDGLQSVTDPNGNTLVVSTNGLTWSNPNAGTNCLSIAFQRDPQGRITNIVDAAGHAMSYAYDTNNNLGTFVNRDGNTNAFTYDATHRLLTLTDARGVQMLGNQYDGAGRLVGSADASGHATTYGHELDQRRDYVTNRLGFVTINEYDEHGNIVRITDPLGAVSSFVYDDNGNLLVKSNATDCHCSVSYTYDADDNRISETDALGNTTHYTFSPLRKILTTTEPSGFATTNTYDAGGNLLSTRDGAGQVATFTYNKVGKVTSMTTRGHTTLYEYNELGFLIREVNPLGHVTEFTADPNGNILSQAINVTQITGLASLEKRKKGWQLADAGTPVIIAGPETNFARLVMRYEYSVGGLPLRTLYYDGSSTEISYDPNGKPATTTGLLGCDTHNTWNLNGQLAERSDCTGCTEHYEYDAEGKVSASTDKRGFTTRFEYDAAGRLIRTTFPDGSQTSATYYSDGALESETSKSGEVTHYTLDANRNRIVVSDSAGTNYYTYNYRKHVTSKIDPLGHTTTYEYDGLGRNTVINYPDGTHKSATFSGRLVTSETDQNGKTTFYDYDALGRLIAVTDPLGHITSYSYDEQGNKISEIDPLGRQTYFEYDTMKHRVKTICPDGSKTAATYDAGGRVLKQVNQMGDETLYEYDPAGRVTKVTDPMGRETQYTYDCGGNKLTQTTPDGRTTRFEYDALSRRTLTTFPDATTETLVYDLPGRMIAQKDQADKTTTFDYDLKNRLIKVTDPLNQQSTFTYDAVGNRITETDALGQITRHDYDLSDRLVLTTYPDHTTLGHAYDGVGRLTAIKDQAGKTSHFAYDAAGHLISSTDPLGNLTTYAYDDAGNRISQTDPNGKTAQFEYDAMNRRTRTLLPDGTSRSISYDKLGLPVSQTDGLGNATIFTFDADGERTEVKDALGHSTQFGYDSMGRISSRTDANNQTTGYEYDALGRLVRTIYPDGSFTSVTYDAKGRRISITDQNGHKTRFAYDDGDRLVSQTDALDQTTEFSYDSLGRLISRKDANGHITGFDYDALGRLKSVVFPDSAVLLRDYDAKGRLIQVTDPRNHATTFSYDDADRLVFRKDALDQSTQYSYDAAGRLISVTDANSHTTTFEYDALGRLKQTTFADGTSRQNGYDGQGRRITETDQAGVEKHYAYDAVGRLTAITDALGQETALAYDPVGRLITQTDANQHATHFEYDALGRRTKRTLPGGQIETLTYDPAGNLITRSDFNGHATAYTYDAINRLTQKAPAAGAPVTFAYDAVGNRLSMTDGSGATTYSHDVRDRLVQKTRSWSVGQASSLSTALNYTYDANGNLTGITSSNPNGTDVGYEYDAVNRLSAVNDARVGRSTYTYDPVGNLQSCVHPNSIADQYAYDVLNRLTSLSALNAQSSNLAAYSYTLEPAGHRIAASETVFAPSVPATTLNRSFNYDPLYRLTNETVTLNAQLSALNYSYDPAGNRLSRQSSISQLPSADYSYDPNDRLAGDTYDANGNTTLATLNDPVSGAARSVADQYDDEDRLVTRETALNAQPATLNLLYDGDGNRVGKTVATGTNTATTCYVVDELNPSGYAQVLEEYVSLNSQPSTLNRVYTYGLSLLSEDQFDGAAWRTSFYGVDGHGSVRYLTDLAGNITDTYDYDAFGNLIARSSSNPQLPTPNNYLFAGEQFDPDLGLYYLRSRYAEPGRGRFWTADSFGGFADDPPSLHRYTFNQNDPVNGIDPSGHFTLAEVGTVVGMNGWVQQAIQSLFDGVNFYSHGLAGGHALKFSTRVEAYMIDSLAVGPGWKFGKEDFWVTQRGAPFLLSQNPDIFTGKKPCWYECVPFDLDADVYGPEARTPVFEMQQSELYGYLEAATKPFLFTVGVAKNLSDSGKAIYELGRDALGTAAYLNVVGLTGDTELADRYFGGSANRLGAMAGGLGRLALDAGSAELYYRTRLFSPGAAEQFFGAGERRFGQDLTILGNAFTGGAGQPLAYRAGYTFGNVAQIATMFSKLGGARTLAEVGTVAELAEEARAARTMSEAALLRGAGAEGQPAAALFQDLEVACKKPPVGVAQMEARTQLAQKLESEAAAELKATAQTAEADVAEADLVAQNGTAEGQISVYNARQNAGVAQSVIDNIDPTRFSPDTRFGKGFYIAEEGETAVAEVSYHGGNASHVIRYELNLSNARVLDLTDPAVVRVWGSPSGNNYAVTQAMAKKAQEAGYNVIKFPSMRGPGNNYVVFDNFDQMLSPQFVAPTR
jgi:RHS repeat-associated protein